MVFPPLFYWYFLYMSKLNTVFRYISHRWSANNRHGIHSPFVYDFLEQVLYDDSNQEDFYELTALRKKLLSDTRSIEITDLGAGSQINPSNIRLVKDIARNSSKHPKYGRLFNRMINYFNIQRVVELGTSLGLSTIYFAKNNPILEVVTVEGCPNTLDIAKENFSHLDLSNISTILGDFKGVLPNVLTRSRQPQLIFFDGNHQETATLDYFEEALKYKTEKSIFIFDDIHWSTGMTHAWDKIKGHPETVVTLDLFFIGIVFFDSKLTPQEFNIKF